MPRKLILLAGLLGVMQGSKLVCSQTKDVNFFDECGKTFQLLPPDSIKMFFVKGKLGQKVNITNCTFSVIVPKNCWLLYYMDGDSPDDQLDRIKPYFSIKAQISNFFIHAITNDTIILEEQIFRTKKHEYDSIRTTKSYDIDKIGVRFSYTTNNTKFPVEIVNVGLPSFTITSYEASEKVNQTTIPKDNVIADKCNRGSVIVADNTCTYVYMLNRHAHAHAQIITCSYEIFAKPGYTLSYQLLVQPMEFRPRLNDHIITMSYKNNSSPDYLVFQNFSKESECTDKLPSGVTSLKYSLTRKKRGFLHYYKYLFNVTGHPTILAKQNSTKKKKNDIHQTVIANKSNYTKTVASVFYTLSENKQWLPNNIQTLRKDGSNKPKIIVSRIATIAEKLLVSSNNSISKSLPSANSYVDENVTKINTVKTRTLQSIADFGLTQKGNHTPPHQDSSSMKNKSSYGHDQLDYENHNSSLLTMVDFDGTDNMDNIFSGVNLETFSTIDDKNFGIDSRNNLSAVSDDDLLYDSIDEKDFVFHVNNSTTATVTIWPDSRLNATAKYGKGNIVSIPKQTKSTVGHNKTVSLNKKRGTHENQSSSTSRFVQKLDNSHHLQKIAEQGNCSGYITFINGSANCQVSYDYEDGGNEISANVLTSLEKLGKTHNCLSTLIVKNKTILCQTSISLDYNDTGPFHEITSFKKLKETHNCTGLILVVRKNLVCQNIWSEKIRDYDAPLNDDTTYLQKIQKLINCPTIINIVNGTLVCHDLTSVGYINLESVEKLVSFKDIHKTYNCTGSINVENTTVTCEITPGQNSKRNNSIKAIVTTFQQLKQSYNCSGVVVTKNKSLLCKSNKKMTYNLTDSDRKSRFFQKLLNLHNCTEILIVINGTASCPNIDVIHSKLEKHIYHDDDYSNLGSASIVNSFTDMADEDDMGVLFDEGVPPDKHSDTRAKVAKKQDVTTHHIAAKGITTAQDTTVDFSLSNSPVPTPKQTPNTYVSDSDKKRSGVNKSVVIWAVCGTVAAIACITGLLFLYKHMVLKEHQITPGHA